MIDRAAGEPVPVGASWRSVPLLVSALLALVLTAVSSLAAWRQPGWLAGLLPLTAAAWGVLGILGLRTHGRRRWVVADREGFRLIDRSGEQRLTVEDVAGLAWVVRRRFVLGQPAGRVRTLRVRFGEGVPAADVERTDVLVEGAADPLEPFADRLRFELFVRATERLHAFRAVDGPQWSLSRHTLQARGAGGPVCLETSEIVAVDVVDGDVCVWRRGEDRPAARIPESDEDSWLLHWLLASQMETDARSLFPEERRSLGRLVFERGASRAATATLSSAGLACLGVAAGTAVAAVWKGQPGLWLVSGGVFLTGMVCGTAWWLGRRRVLRCFERGVEQQGVWGSRAVRFAEVTGLTWRTRRRFVQGSYSGTMQRLELETSEGRVVRHSRTVAQQDRELERLRDRIAADVAGRMLRRLEAGEPVAWTPRVWIRADGIVVERGSRGEREVVPHAAVTLYQVEGERFHLWTNYQERAVLNVSTGERNFFAGLVALQTWLERHGGPGEKRAGVESRASGRRSGGVGSVSGWQ